jgi:integrase
MAHNAPIRIRREGERPEPRRIKLTNHEVDKLPTAAERYVVYDTVMPGLLVRVNPGGGKAFYFTGRVSGRHRKMKLGNHPSLTVKQAREQVQKLSGQAADGVDPVQQRKQQRRQAARVWTLEAAWRHYRDHYLAEHCSPNTAMNDRYLFEATNLKQRRLDSITTNEIKRLYDRLSKERGPTMANRVVQFLRRLFNYAAEELGYEGDNPVKLQKGRTRRNRRGQGKAVALAPESSRSRYIEPREMPAFLRTLRGEQNERLTDFLWLLLFTGARRANVLAMRWGDISLTRAVWTIPADAAKAGEPITLPLSSHAQAVVKRRRKYADEGAVFVFPSSQAVSGHMMDPNARWRTLRQRAGLDDVTLHDLRRTVGSWASMIGVAYPIVKAMLGHTEGGDITAIYARTDLETVRDGFERTAKAMMRREKLGVTLATAGVCR